MPHALRGKQEAGDDHRDLGAGGEPVAAEAVVRPAVENAGCVKGLYGAEVLRGDLADIGDRPVAYRGHILGADGAAEYVSKVVAVDDNSVKVNALRAGRGDHVPRGAVSVIGAVPVVAVPYGRVQRVAEVSRVDAGGDDYGLSPCHGVLRPEGAVLIAKQDALVIGDLNAGISPMI